MCCFLVAYNSKHDYRFVSQHCYLRFDNHLGSIHHAGGTSPSLPVLPQIREGNEVLEGSHLNVPVSVVKSNYTRSIRLGVKPMSNLDL